MWCWLSRCTLSQRSLLYSNSRDLSDGSSQVNAVPDHGHFPEGNESVPRGDVIMIQVLAVGTWWFLVAPLQKERSECLHSILSHLPFVLQLQLWMGVSSHCA